MKSTLAKVADAFNAAEIVWAVGASVLLHRHGLVDNPTDLDIIVRKKDIDKANSILSSLGTRKGEKEKSGIYSTDFFFEYVIDQTEVDVMAGFKINLPDHHTYYEYLFDKSSISEIYFIKYASVPMAMLEDWYILYQLMPNRENKVELIEKHFYCKGLVNTEVLKKALITKLLPPDITKRITSTLKKITSHSAHTASTNTGK